MIKLLLITIDNQVINSTQRINRRSSKEMFKFRDAGKVDLSGKIRSDSYEPEDVFLALNIALRKSVEKAIKEKSYKSTEVLQRTDTEKPWEDY